MGCIDARGGEENVSKEERLEEMNKKMIARGKLMSNLANRKRFGKAFGAATKRYDKLEAAWRRLRKEAQE
jgi:hypothetical protein